MEEIKLNDEVVEETTEVTNEEVVLDPETGKWTTKEKIGTGFVLGTSAIGTGYLIYKVGKPVYEGTKKACKKVWNGVKSLFGKKAPEEEPEEEKKSKKASTKKATKKVEKKETADKAVKKTEK